MLAPLIQSRSTLWLFALAALALLPGCGKHGEGESAATHDEAPARVTVRTQPAERRTVEETIDGFGRTETAPSRLVTLTPAVQGQVERILVNLGDHVGQGDLIVAMDTRLVAADVAERKANRDALQAALAGLQAEPRVEDRKGLELAVEQGKVGVDRAKAVVDRLRPLRIRNEVSDAQVFDAEQALAQARLVEQAAQAQLQLLLAGPRPEAIAEAQARLAAAEESLSLAETRLQLCSVRAPIDGVVDSLTCHPGQALAAGTPIGELVDPRELFVTLWMSPLRAGKVKPGQTARVTIGTETVARTGQDNADVATAAGRVHSIGRIVDVGTGNVPVRIAVENADQALAVGQTANVSIVVGEQEDSIVVPNTAVVDLGEGPLVVAVREGKIVPLHPTAVTTHGKWTVIAGTDLAPGEPVLVDGGFNLPEDTEVKLESSEPAAHDEVEP
jgi:RND family efflux transporter MFP subunit